MQGALETERVHCKQQRHADDIAQDNCLHKHQLDYSIQCIQVQGNNNGSEVEHQEGKRDEQAPNREHLYYMAPHSSNR